MKIEKIDINKIKRDENQPRKEFVDIGELASSIINEGLLEPLKVRKEKEDYILVDGERRYKALRMIYKKDNKRNKIDCVVISPKEIFITQLSYDLHKRKLDPFEEATAFKKLLEEGWKLNELKGRLGIPKQTITRRIKLLGLNPHTIKLIKQKKIPYSIVAEISFQSFKDNETKILQRIDNEVSLNANSSREKIKRIIKEETQKEQAILEHFEKDLNNIIKLIDSYDFKLSKFKIEDYHEESITDVINCLNKTLNKLDTISSIDKKIRILSTKLSKIRLKYGGGVILDEELVKKEKIKYVTSKIKE